MVIIVPPRKFGKTLQEECFIPSFDGAESSPVQDLLEQGEIEEILVFPVLMKEIVHELRRAVSSSGVFRPALSTTFQEVTASILKIGSTGLLDIWARKPEFTPQPHASVEFAAQRLEFLDEEQMFDHVLCTDVLQGSIGKRKFCRPQIDVDLGAHNIAVGPSWNMP